MERKCSTVAELIAKLETLSPNAPVYARSKYTGATDPFEDYPVSVNGVSKMEAHGADWVTILF
jgi:hypothetical protein